MPAKKTKPNKPTKPPLPKRVSKLTDLRLKHRLSLDDVAIDTGAFRSAISRWENGKAEPTAQFRVAYAKCLGLTVQELGTLIYGGIW